MAALLYERSNDALNTNPPIAPINITTHGSDWYWAAFAFFGLLALVYLVLSQLAHSGGARVLQNMLTMAAFITAVGYFTLASDLGSVAVVQEFSHEGVGPRQVYYARYIMWFLTTPFIQGSLLMLSGVGVVDSLVSLFWAELYVVGRLLAAITPTSYKWGYFTIGLVAWFVSLYYLVVPVRRAAVGFGSDVSRHYSLTTGLWGFLFTLYAIAFGLSEGGNRITPDSEGAFYGVLDVLTIGCVSAVFIFGLRKLNLERIAYSSGATTRTTRAGEKPIPAAAASTNGAEVPV